MDVGRIVVIQPSVIERASVERIKLVRITHLNKLVHLGYFSTLQLLNSVRRTKKDAVVDVVRLR